MTVERKLESIWWSQLSRAVAFVLFCLFAAPAAQAMLLELHFTWDSTSSANLLSSYRLQEGSIIQIIGIQKNSEYDPSSTPQFEWYGTAANTCPPQPALPTDSDLTDRNVYLADTTPEGTDIVYTGAIQNFGTTDHPSYGFYTQFSIDSDVYDSFYIRIFGATNFPQGELFASYWNVSDPIDLDPSSFLFQSFETNNMTATNNANYFEVIPEPATLGLLGLGGCALAAWRRRRPHRREEDNR